MDKYVTLSKKRLYVCSVNTKKRKMKNTTTPRPATNIEWDKNEKKFVGLPVAINGPADRVLLIADEDTV